MLDSWEEAARSQPSSLHNMGGDKSRLIGHGGTRIFRRPVTQICVALQSNEGNLGAFSTRNQGEMFKNRIRYRTFSQPQTSDGEGRH